MKMLISAFACHPKMGSEDGVGWGWVSNLANHHEVHVITRKFRSPDIEAALKEMPIDNLFFHYADPPSWLIFWKRGSRNFMPYAVLWQFFALFLSVRLSFHHRFDIVQHLTYGNLWLPSFLFLIPGRYVWGPVGGGVVSAVYAKKYCLRDRFVELLRCFVQRYLSWLNLPILLSMARARVILARTNETIGLLPKWARRKAILLPETALDLSLFSYDDQQRYDVCRSAMFVFVYAGRILALKNLHLAITAYRELLCRYPYLYGRVRFDIFGDGSYLSACRKLAGDEAGRSIIFHGLIDRSTLFEKLREAHLFVHLSGKDTAATAPMEAMALGLPVICLNIGGMGNLVDNSCGVILENSDPKNIIQEVVDAMYTLIENRERLLELSLSARQKVEHSFCWERRIEQYNNILKKEFTEGI